MNEEMTPHNALRILERQIDRARTAVGVLDGKRALNDPAVGEALDVLWGYVLKGGTPK